MITGNLCQAMPISYTYFDKIKEIAVDSTRDTCVGSVGDAIVHIDFGSGLNPGPPLAPGITNLIYTNSACPNDGSYTLSNNSTACFSQDWFSTPDHTGNYQGYFMLINASYTPNDFYVQTVNNLCSGTTFEFSAWIINMNNLSHGALILSNVTFTIEKTDGTVLQTYNTGNIPQTYSPTWVKYGFYFTTPSGINTVVLRMRNNAPGGNGNDLGLDDITFRPVGPKISSSVKGFNSDSLTICLGNGPVPDSLHFVSSIQKCYALSDFQWQKSMDKGITWNDIPGATSTVYSVKILDTGFVQYRIASAQPGNISNSNCRFVSKDIKVGVYNTVYPSLRVQSSGDSVCSGNAVSFTAQVSYPGSNPQYQWFLNGNKVGTNSPYFTNPNPQDKDSVYCLFKSSLPCTQALVSKPLGISVYPYPTIQIPSAFYLKNGKSMILNPVITGNIASYTWIPSTGLNNPSIPNPIASPLTSTQYTLILKSVNGCIDTAKTTVYVIYDLDIPNIFSPNNDGINDLWNIGHLTDFVNNTVDIFNRYGQLVFHSLGYGAPWDGKQNGYPLPVGTYYYIINPHFGTKIFTGSITLIR